METPLSHSLSKSKVSSNLTDSNFFKISESSIELIHLIKSFFFVA